MGKLRKKQQVVWHDLEMEIVRLYSGPPQHQSGQVLGPQLTVWHLLKGQVQVWAGDREAVARKGEEWLVRKPGLRSHRFSPDAEVLAVNVFVRSRHNAALWQGPGVVTFPNDSKMKHAVDHLWDTTLIRDMVRSGELNPTRVPSELESFLQFREAEVHFFHVLLNRMEKVGITFDAPKIQDERVRESLRTLLHDPDFSKPFSREELAGAHGLSPSRFGRIWQRELGITPKQFWERQKLEYVQDLLQNTNMPIKEICFSSGFAHLSQFSLWCKRHFGESPRQYRNRFFE
ncbi:MAG: helix-turn-helix transcriptional regulator [Kiritimatiellia bacterium]